MEVTLSRQSGEPDLVVVLPRNSGSHSVTERIYLLPKAEKLMEEMFLIYLFLSENTPRVITSIQAV